MPCCWPGSRSPPATTTPRSEHLQSPPLGELTPRRALVRQLLLAAAAISRGDPMAAGILAGALRTARLGGFCNTVVTTAPQVTSYLVEHSAQMRPDPFTGQLIGAALEVRAAQPEADRSRRVLAEPLTAAETAHPEAPADQHLPADRGDPLHFAQHGQDPPPVRLPQARGGSRSEAIERAVDLRLL